MKRRNRKQQSFSQDRGIHSRLRGAARSTFEIDELTHDVYERRAVQPAVRAGRGTSSDSSPIPLNSERVSLALGPSSFCMNASHLPGNAGQDPRPVSLATDVNFRGRSERRCHGLLAAGLDA